MKKTAYDKFKDYNFRDAKPAQAIPHLRRLAKGKTRISIMLDDDLLAEFRRRAKQKGLGYQTLINEVLRAYLTDTPDITEALRKLIRMELEAA